MVGHDLGSSIVAGAATAIALEAALYALSPAEQLRLADWLELSADNDDIELDSAELAGMGVAMSPEEVKQEVAAHLRELAAGIRAHASRRPVKEILNAIPIVSTRAADG